MYAGTAAAAAIGGTGASGAWLFSYNKENFGNDSGMRFGRFMMARGNACAQVAQYREDIAGITGVTVTKMDAWTSVATLFMAVGAALSCAGRIGMHGCAQPGWYCCLFSGSIFMSIMFNGTALWFAMHASLRAQCAATSLLTRQIRLPIPSMGQLDQARVFASAFEKQPTRDMFRVPFMRHPNAAPDMPHFEEEAKGKKSKKHTMHDPQKEFGSTARDTVPSWIRDEVVVDKGDGFMGNGKEPIHELDEVPDHFKLLMKAQEEWRDYEIYARISMLYGVCSFLYAVTYYAVGYAIVELRGFWAMWSLPMVFMTAQMLIMRLDILKTGQHRLPNAEWLGHLAPYFAVAACTLEYRYFYSESCVALAFGFALLAQFAHFVMALRWLDLAWPDEKKADMPEEPGKQWWPGSWQVPSAFTKHLWFITPPKKLDPAVSPCLLHEMADMAAHGGGFETCSRRKGKAPAGKDTKGMSSEAAEEGAHGGSSLPSQAGRKDLPWQLMRVVILTAALQWLFAMLATSAEIILGPDSLMKPPGEPPWIRDTKYRHFTPAMVHLSTEDGLSTEYRLFSASKARYTDQAPAADHATAPEETHAEETQAEAAGGAGHRRLAKANGTDAAFEELLKLMPLIGDLVERAGAGAERYTAPGDNIASLPAPPQPNFMAPGAKVKQVSWPSLFEPRHLVCGGPELVGRAPVVLALTARGVGASVHIGQDEEDVRAQPFSLDGLGAFGRIAGAGWTSNGLQLVTAAGDVLECPGRGASANGVWPCRKSENAPLPVPAGTELVAAAVAEANDASTEPLVAIVLKHAPQYVSLYRASGGAWHPAGEVHVPPGFGPRPSLTLAGQELTIVGASVEVHRRHLLSGVSTLHPPPVGGVAREFRAACSLPTGEVLRLALKQAGSAWGPELITAA